MSGVTVEEVEAEALIDLRHRVLRAGRPRETAHMPGDDAPTSRHFRLVVEDRTVAIASVMAEPFPGPPGGEAPADGPTQRLRGMAVDPDVQGQGLGAQLLRAVQERYPALWCNARVHAARFYARQGWTQVGEAF
ncbi:MAG: GNAT family N-acetyltransferase, partial [Myxococcota bacterium]